MEHSTVGSRLMSGEDWMSTTRVVAEQNTHAPDDLFIF